MTPESRIATVGVHPTAPILERGASLLPLHVDGVAARAAQVRKTCATDKPRPYGAEGRFESTGCAIVEYRLDFQVLTPTF